MWASRSWYFDQNLPGVQLSSLEIVDKLLHANRYFWKVIQWTSDTNFDTLNLWLWFVSISVQNFDPDDDSSSALYLTSNR